MMTPLGHYQADTIPFEANGPLKEEISEFIGSFLHPYIQHQITRECDQGGREPLIDMLHRRYEKIPLEVLASFALYEYLYHSVIGLYAHLNTTEEIRPWSEQSYILFRALHEALPKDFPQMQIQACEVNNIAQLALIEGNKRRAIDIAYAKSFFVAHYEDREEIMSKLEASGSLFLEHKEKEPVMRPYHNMAPIHEDITLTLKRLHYTFSQIHVLYQDLQEYLETVNLLVIYAVALKPPDPSEEPFLKNLREFLADFRPGNEQLDALNKHLLQILIRQIFIDTEEEKLFRAILPAMITRELELSVQIDIVNETVYEKIVTAYMEQTQVTQEFSSVNIRERLEVATKLNALGNMQRKLRELVPVIQFILDMCGAFRCPGFNSIQVHFDSASRELHRMLK